MIETQPQIGNQMVAAPWLRGMDPQYETNVSNLSTNVVAGSSDLEGSTVLVGAGLARELRLSLGDRIAIYSPSYLKEIRRCLEEKKRDPKKELDQLPLPDDFTVTGIFDVGYNDYNVNVIVTSLEKAQELLLRLQQSRSGGS